MQIHVHRHTHIHTQVTVVVIGVADYRYGLHGDVVPYINRTGGAALALSRYLHRNVTYCIQMRDKRCVVQGCCVLC